MKIGDHVYFAPGIRFANLDLAGTTLPTQYTARIEGHYLTPAERAARQGDAFAAGLLAVAAIDAMARLYYGPTRSARSTGQDFKGFVHQRLKSFAEPRHAAILYEKYRNGLVHEARIKDGCQFEIGCTETLDISGITPVINPACLVIEIRMALKEIIQELCESQQFRNELADHIRKEFSYELR